MRLNSLVIFALISYLCTSVIFAQSACDRSQKTEFFYPLIVKGAKELHGFDIKGLAAYSYKDGAWQRIPVQVDEVNARGDFVLSGGLPFTKDTDDSYYDENDELVVDGRDLGLRTKLSSFPKEILKDVAVKWWVDFCEPNYVGSFLLLYYHGSKPFYFPKTAVPFDHDSGEVSTELYRYTFHQERAALLGQVFLKSPDEPSKEKKIFETSSFLMPMYTPWYLPSFTLSNESFVSTIESWQVGPIRTIVAVGVKLKGFLSLFDFHMFSELVFYKNMFQIPTMIEFTFEPRKFFTPGSGIVYAITYAEGMEWEIETNIAELPLKDAEDILKSEPRASKFGKFYAQSQRPEGSFRVEVDVDPLAADDVPPPFQFGRPLMAKKEYQEYWPWLEDLDGDLGIFIDFSQVRKGVYKFGLDLFLHHKAEQRALRVKRPHKAFFQKQ